MMAYVMSILKAITAAVVAFLGAILTALDDNSISAQEWVTAVIALVVALGAVWAVPWKPTATEGVD